MSYKAKLTRNDYWNDNFSPFDFQENKNKLQQIGLDWRNVSHIVEKVSLASHLCYIRLSVLVCLVNIIMGILLISGISSIGDRELLPKRYEFYLNVVIIALTSVFLLSIINFVYFYISCHIAMRNRIKTLLEDENAKSTFIKYYISPLLNLEVQNHQQGYTNPTDTLLQINANDLIIEKVFHVPINFKCCSEFPFSNKKINSTDNQTQQVIERMNQAYSRVISAHRCRNTSYYLAFLTLFAIFDGVLVLYYMGLYTLTPFITFIFWILFFISFIGVGITPLYTLFKTAKDLYVEYNRINEEVSHHGMYIDAKMSSVLVAIITLNRSFQMEEVKRLNIINRDSNYYF